MNKRILVMTMAAIVKRQGQPAESQFGYGEKKQNRVRQKMRPAMFEYIRLHISAPKLFQAGALD